MREPLICWWCVTEIASAAFLVLRLLGRFECLLCGERISRKHKGVPFTCGTDIGDADFNRIEPWLAKKHKRNGYDCGEYESLTPLDNSLVDALIP